MNKIDKKVIELMQNIKLIVFDFDGVFTDNSVFVDQNGVESVRCSRSDGLGLRLLDKINIQYCIISSEVNPVVTIRAKKLKIDVTQGHNDKLVILREIVNTKNLKMNNIAYVGNDINDLEAMSHAKVRICPNDAEDSIKEISNIILERNGGKGVIREIFSLLTTE